MPVAPAIMVASAGIQAISSIAAGNAASTEAKYNAKLKEQEASSIDLQSRLAATQADRQIGRAASTLTARVGKSGVMMSGSPMAALIDMQTQMELDKSIGQYNYNVQKNFALSEAEAYKRQAKTARMKGYMGAFSTLLQTGAYMGMSNMSNPLATKPTADWRGSTGGYNAYLRSR